jgi:hypothetical protein
LGALSLIFIFRCGSWKNQIIQWLKGGCDARPYWEGGRSYFYVYLVKSSILWRGRRAVIFIALVVIAVAVMLA